MNDTVQRHFRQTLAALVALSVVLSVFGPVGTAVAQPSVSVDQSADSTTVAPGGEVTFTTEFSVAELNAPQMSVDLPDGWEVESQSAEGPAAYNGEGTWQWLAGDNDGVDVSYTVEYTVSVPDDASGEYTISADGSALSPADSSATEASDSTTITVQEPDQNEAPSASFDANPDSPEVGESVSFDASASSDSDGSIASYQWEFGDGETATGATATHTYDAAGDYEVTLTVTDDDGETDSVTQTVTVQEAPNEAPSVSISGPSSAQVGDEVSFDASASDSDGSIESYDWNFGDGTSDSGESVTHTYDSAGDYTVTVTVTDDDGDTATATQSVSVSEAPEPASYQVSNLNVESPVTQGDASTVTATVENTGDEDGTQTVALDVDGSEIDSESVTLAAGASQQVSFEVDTTGLSVGDHDVTVSTDDDSETETLAVTEEPPANQDPSAAFDYTPQSPTAGTQVSFDASASSDDSGIVNYEWEFGDGATETGETATHTYDAAGDYEVTLTVTDDDGETDSVTQTVTVSADEPEPEPELSTAVSVTPNQDLLGVNGETVFEIVVTDADGGVGAYTMTVSLGNASTAHIADVAAMNADNATLTDVAIAQDGSSASVDAVLVDTAENGSVSLLSLTLVGDAAGETSVDLSVDALGTEAGQPYEVTEENGATLTVSELVVGAAENPAQDPDGDGVYEDVNGDGEVDELDVQLLFAERNSDVVTSNTDAFDVNGDGEFDVLDIQALYYEEVA